MSVRGVRGRESVSAVRYSGDLWFSALTHGNSACVCDPALSIRKKTDSQAFGGLPCCRPRCSSLAPHSRALSLAPAPFPINGPHCSHAAHLLHARHAPSPADRSAQTSMLTRRCASLRISEKRFMCSGVHAHKQAPQALGAAGALAWGALCVAFGLAPTQQPP